MEKVIAAWIIIQTNMQRIQQGWIILIVQSLTEPEAPLWLRSNHNFILQESIQSILLKLCFNIFTHNAAKFWKHSLYI